MSAGSFTSRDRVQSHGSIRKRLLRSNSESKYKDLHKNSTMTSFRPKFERLLQEGKVDQILNTDPHSKANLFYTTHINEMEKQLAASKKSLSTMVMKSKGKEYSINKLKGEIAKIERDSAILRGQSQMNKNKFNDNKERLERKKDELQEKAWQEKCYRHMNSRLDKDEQFLKGKHDRKQQEVFNLKEECRLLETKFYNLCQTHKKLTDALHTARHINKEQTEQKNQFIDLLNQEMAEKDLLEDMKMEKKYRDREINDIAPSMIEREELQKYMEIMFTHRVVSEIIKVKSKKLMDELDEVQKGYMYIKSNTNIVEMDKILDRMEHQDDEYEKLLKKVAVLQQELLSTSKQMDKAVEQEYNILSMGEQEEYKNRGLGIYQGLQKDKYEILVCEKDKMTQRRNSDQILKKKIVLWVQEHAKIFNVDIKVKNEEDFFAQLSMLATNMSKSIK